MAIKIEIKPIVYDVEIPGYGIFHVSPMGAGAEAELRILARKFNDAAERIKKYDGLVERENKGEKIDHNSKEWKEAAAEYIKAGELADELKDTNYAKLRSVFKGEKVDQLFQDFTYKQLSEIYKKVLKQNNG